MAGNPPIDGIFPIAMGQVPIPCWTARADGRLLWVNQAWRALTGVDAPPALEAWLEQATTEEIALRCRLGEPFEVPLALRGAVAAPAMFVARMTPATDPLAPEVAWMGLCLPAQVSAPGQHDRAFLTLLGEHLRQEHQPEAILDYANRALGEHLGALRVGYGEVDEGGEWLTLRADWTAGVESNAGRFPLASFGPEIVAENRAGRTFVSNDLASDARIGPDYLEAFARWGVAGLIAIPLIKHGQFTALLSIQSDRPRLWTAGEVAVAEEAAERSWEALERSRVQARLLATQANQAFLLSLGDRLRHHETASDVLREAVEMLGHHLTVGRVGYAEMDTATDVLSVDIDWVSGDLASIVGRYPLMSFGAENIAALARGETVRITDLDESPLVCADNRPAFEAMGIRSSITVPLVKRERLIAVLSVQHGTARDWTEAEVRLVEEVAERTWSTVERATAEAALRQSEERLRFALEGAQLGTWDYDLKTLKLWWSPRTCEIFGIPYADEIPDALRYTFVHPDDRERYLKDVDEAVFAGRPFSIEYRIIRPDGEIRWVVLRGRCTIDEHGAPARASGITIDTTDRNRAEAELARSREALHQTEKLTALGSLLAGVAHELNNPLAVVVAYSAMLEEEAVGTAHGADAAKIRAAAERCGKIVQTFLAMARQRPPERREVDVGAAVRAALDLADYGLRTAGVEVVAHLAPDLPATEADGSQLQQVFANLFVNAQQAMLEKQGERRLTITTGLDGSDMIRVEVSDTGLGIASETQRRIFEPFFTTKPQGSGTGIGLSFSLGVVEAHGGRLELVQSTPEGSTFAVTLVPVGRLRENESASPRSQTIAARPRSSVLVVDDEADLLAAITAILKREGYEVLTALSGAAAKDILAARDVDLLLSDLRMPGLDGPGLFAWLEVERPALARRTAFLTGDTLGAEAVRFLMQAGRPFIEKPFSPSAVRALLAELAA